MTHAVGGNATRPCRARAVFFGSGSFLLILAIVLAPAFAAGPSVREATKGNPHLASLQVEIWPEFDRPAALVILRGTLAADIKLPADVRLRIPASSGGPSAMAYSAQEGGNLLNLPYERNDTKDFITLRFKGPERYFHVEFYDPLATGAPERSYTYAWPGDMSMNQLRVIVQEPAAASNFSVQPSLDATAAGPEGLRYHSADLGAQEAGKQLPIKVRYSRTDLRTSTELLKLETPAATPQAITGPSKKELALWLIAVVAVLALGGIAGSAWWYRRNTVSKPQASGARFCPKCGSPSASGNNFCSKCGAPLE